GTGYIDGSPNTATGTIISEEGFTTYFSDDFANNSQGWTLGTEWQIGAATTSTGQNYGNPDPGTDNTPTADNGVAGVVIGGNASTALHGFYYLTSPVINTSTANQLFFEFARWLNSDYTPYMQNTVDIFNGSSWVNLWSSGASPEVQDNAWTPQQFDISAYKSASTQIRFGFNVGSSDVYTVSSWNLDDVKIYGDGGVTTKSISIAKTTDGNEAGPVSSVFTLTRTGDLSSALTVNYTLAGTATLGSDYNDPSLGQATFAAGADKATITLPTKDDLLSEPSETIITTITAPAGYTITGPDTATATIIDDDLGTLTLVKTTDGKEAGPVSSVFTLTRTGDLSSALTVNYTLGGTATPGVDYTGTTPNSVTFAAGSSKATITLPTKDDLLSDPSETIITTITAPVGYTISGPDTATATILDNDGNLDNNNLVGTSFADALAGEGGNDTLNGGAGNDTLDGGVGVDLMDGGDNNDTYYVDNVGDIVKESSDDALGGTADTVFASVTYSLAPGTPGKQGYGIENLTLTGDANINATGNGKNNVLTGNSGSNVLNGGLGNDTLNGDLGLDTLTGGAGNDFFRFDNVENSDLITDFSVADDTIILANSLDGTLTGSLGMGIKGLVFNSANANGSVLNAAWFFKGAGFTGGASGNPAGIYVNTSNGDIWYNDSTVVGSYLMANVGAGAAAAMTNLDFVYRV
ncbi:MAG: Calx-beta domain-containing protein, partial [Microcystis panniformis]